MTKKTVYIIIATHRLTGAEISSHHEHHPEAVAKSIAMSLDVTSPLYSHRVEMITKDE